MIERNHGVFDQDEFERYVLSHRKVCETILIIWQNLLDVIDSKPKPLVSLGEDFQEEHMPLLAKLVLNRGGKG